MMQLGDSVLTLPFVGQAYSYKLRRLDIETVADLLFHFPVRHENRSKKSLITQVVPGETVLILATLRTLHAHKSPQRGLWIIRALVFDESGTMEVIWFNQRYLLNQLIKGQTYYFYGKAVNTSGRLQLAAPEFEKVTSEPFHSIHLKRLVPIYPETDGVSSKWLRRRVYELLPHFPTLIHERLPQDFCHSYDLLPFWKAISEAHFPSSVARLEKAKKTIAFEQLFRFQLIAYKRRQIWRSNSVQPSIFLDETLIQFIDTLPFKLTQDQTRCIQAIRADIAKTYPMNRMIQGDVGSGKTIVAIGAAYMMSLVHKQTVVMAPTEILAAQHLNVFKKALEPFGLRIGHLTSSSRKISPNFDVLIGTHALLHKRMPKISRLGLVVIDEQQRFGVFQRAYLRTLGQHPHYLTLTATPIPRTLALSYYGDIDVSAIETVLPGRKSVKTWVIPESKRADAYRFITKEIARGNQAFVICPFVKESDKLQVKAAEAEFEVISQRIFPQFKVGLLHGKLPAKTKTSVLEAFSKEKYQILVATPVIEVGIDIPNATVMLIEGAERFGLAQLHQLRGRVGRRQEQAYCLCFTTDGNSGSYARLKQLEKYQNGLKLAEYDLKYRGSGDLFGFRQHGQFDLQIKSVSDPNLLSDTKSAVSRLILEDPSLKKHTVLKELIQPYLSELVDSG